MTCGIYCGLQLKYCGTSHIPTFNVSTFQCFRLFSQLKVPSLRVPIADLGTTVEIRLQTLEKLENKKKKHGQYFSFSHEKIVCYSTIVLAPTTTKRK